MLDDGSCSADITNCTFLGNAGYSSIDGGAAISLHDTGQIAVNNSVLAFQVGPLPAIDESTWGVDRDVPLLSCCDIYGNEGGDWVGVIADEYGINGNISEDPLFCDHPGGDYTLSCASPCAPENNPDCGLIGAWPVACGASPVERTTWGRLRQTFGEEANR